jgi:hypothetical protein
MVVAAGRRLRHGGVRVGEHYCRHSCLGRASQGLPFDVRGRRCIVRVSDSIHIFFRLLRYLGRFEERVLTEVKAELGRLLFLRGLQNHRLLMRYFLLLHFNALRGNSRVRI